MDRDGTGQGFDCDLTRQVSRTVRIPVIASGGAGSAEHFIKVFRTATPTLLSPPLYFTMDWTALSQLKQRLRDAGIPVRWPC